MKIRGNRIELGEIESALRTVDGVAEAACAAVPLDGTATLCAYLVAAESQEVPSIETLRSALSNQLPAYMVPSSFTILESLPLTTSGKVDRRSLPVPGVGDRPALEQAYVQPEGETEMLQSVQDTAIFPLATPSIASPGAMMAVVLLTENQTHTLLDQAVTAVLMLLVVSMAFGLMLLAGTISKLIGSGGASIVSRVMGLILASIAATHVLEGAKEYFQ